MAVQAYASLGWRFQDGEGRAAGRDLSSAMARLPPPAWQVVTRGAGLQTLILVISVLCSWGLSAGDLGWHSAVGYRWAELSVPKTGKTGFTLLPGSSTGILFTNTVSIERGIENRNLLGGSGVAAGDVDRDGRCDLFFAGMGRCALYRNLGDWKFQDITEAAGVACAGQDSTGAVFADIDGDGDLDLIVNSLGNGARVFENDGRGQFKEVTGAAGTASKSGGTSLALADVNGDGNLDLFVVNYRTTTIMDQPTTKFLFTMQDGKPVVTHVNGQPATSPDLTNRFVVEPLGDVIELGEPSLLYLNDGKGHFKPVSWTDGSFLDEDGRPLADAPRDWGLSVQFHDMNGDGTPDIYVCSDLFSPDRIWINDGKGNFRAIERIALRCTSNFSMGVDFGDLNRDGYVDFMVADMLATRHKDRHTQVSQTKPTRYAPGTIDNRPQVWRNTLQINRGDTTFQELSLFGHVEASNWSWTPIFLDVDLDGYEDILVPNGQMRDFQNVDSAMQINTARATKQLNRTEIMDMVKTFPVFTTPSIAFHNRGDLTFEEVGAAWGFTSSGVSQGTALADLDNDGALDVVVNRLNEQAGIYRNDTAAPRLAIRLKGLPGNVQGIGAKLQVSGGPVTQSQEVICGGHYLSGADPMRVFAAGSLTNHLTIEVTWRSGKKSVVTNALPNALYEIDEAQAHPITDHASHPQSPIFTDVSPLLNHTHHEDPYDDFERQPLMPIALSQLGPGISWLDIDGDGWDDLFIGGGRGGLLAGFRNLGNGTFTPMTNAPLARRVARDQTTILGLGSVLLVGSSNYEDGQTNGGYLRVYDLQQQRAGESILNPTFSAGPLALGDIDNDGDLDLFIGGRVLPGRYPEAAPSLLLKNDGGRFSISQSFDKLGLVSGALFSDLDGDGIPEIILACEWGPVRVFRMQDGAYKEVTKQLGLAGYTGWWNGVATGDFDGDGRLDIVASNWGLNTKYRPTPQQPVRIYYGDFTGNGAVDIIEACFDLATGREVPNRGLRPVSAAMPFVQEKIETFAAYGEASLQDIYGDKLKTAGVVEANTLASMVFLNRGDHFEATPLPAQAQWAPAFGICVADMDGNGTEDIFLSQNFFAVTLEDWRHDAGRGLWLRGDGHGKFEAVPGQESGVTVYGEQRGCAVCDFDGDGRVDLAVTQNANATKLYQNRGAKPGLRVRLLGPPGNPNAAGASLRLRYGERQGPAREIQAGSGYWSQNSMIQVMPVPEAPTHIWIRWPGGKTTTTPLVTGAKEISVDLAGTLKVLK